MLFYVALNFSNTILFHRIFLILFSGFLPFHNVCNIKNNKKINKIRWWKRNCIKTTYILYIAHYYCSSGPLQCPDSAATFYELFCDLPFAEIKFEYCLEGSGMSDEFTYLGNRKIVKDFFKCLSFIVNGIWST